MVQPLNRQISSDARPTSETWKPLYFFNLYRVTLSGLLLTLFVSGLGPNVLGKTDPILFLITVAGYLLLSMVALTSTYVRRPPFRLQVYVHLTIDIIAITLMMHASGGISSGLGMLLIVSLAGGTLLISGYIAIFFAAFTTCAVLFEQLYAQLSNTFTSTAYTQAGLLGIAFFATTLVLQRLVVKVHETEALALKRGIDLANLAQLNDYVIQHMDSGALVVDQTGEVRLINETACAMFGINDRDAIHQLEQISPNLVEQLRAWTENHDTFADTLLDSETVQEIRCRFVPLGRREDDSGTLIFLEDMADLSRQAQQLKLAALGQLTASIAHEIRNPLGAISHAGQLLAESPDLDSGDRRFTEIILDQSQRVNGIVENVLQISRREPSHPEQIELQPWLEQFFADYCEHSQANEALLRLEIEPETTVIKFDPTQLRQILSNLVDNAIRHGGPAADGTRLWIRGGSSDSSSAPYLEVIDFGPGIDEEMANNIFDPFFTTHSSGTGLGLYIARELCQLNTARLEYRRAESGGASFRIIFSAPSN